MGSGGLNRNWGKPTEMRDKCISQAVYAATHSINSGAARTVLQQAIALEEFGMA